MPVSIIKAPLPMNAALAVAEKMEGRLKSAFLRAVASLKDSVTIDALQSALATGDVNSAMAILGIDKKFIKALNGSESDAGIVSFKDALTETFVEGMMASVVDIPRAVRMDFGSAFSLKNPEVKTYLDKYTFPLIRQISDNTTEAIRGVVSDAFGQGGHPFQQARKIKTFIGLTDTQARAVRNYRNMLSNPDTVGTSLTRALRDGRFDGTVRAAVRNNTGLPASQIDVMVQRYQERYLQYRARNIARSESVRASNKGQHALWADAKAKGLLDSNVRRMWIVSGDPATCDECLELDGTEVGLDEPFAPDVDDPGDVHTDCRCGQALVFPKVA